ncbi:hypothetical protein [Hydrogenophaga sp.]|uniref:hypothetical protein n=1 Tax=Hydrogenophaga sp. TaxID=1904254 RepID=UPI003D1072EE
MKTTDITSPNTDDTRTVAEVEEHIRLANALPLLCEAWGESDLPCAFIAYTEAEIRKFIVNEWLGDPDDPHATEVIKELANRDWPEKGDWVAEFEIGGVSFKRVYESNSRAAISKHEADKAAGVGGEAVAWVDERAISWLASRANSKTAHITTQLSKEKSFERPMALFAAAPTKEAEQAEAPSDPYLDGIMKRLATQPQASGAGEGPDAMQIADLIDPLTRKQAPDHLTMAVAAMALRALATKPPADLPAYYVSGPYTVGKHAGWHSVCETATARVVAHFKPDQPPAGEQKPKFQAIYFRRNTGIDRLIVPAAEDPGSHVDRILITKIELLYTAPAQPEQVAQDIDKLIDTEFESVGYIDDYGNFEKSWADWMRQEQTRGITWRLVRARRAARTRGDGGGSA